MPLPSGLQVFSGNLVFLAVQSPDGNTYDYVGLGQNATISQNAGLVAASGIGDNRVRQWVPGMATVSVSVTDMALRNQSYESLGLAPENSLTDLLTLTPFTIFIFDQVGASAPIKTVVDCLYDSGTLTITKHEPLSISVTFNGIDVSGTMLG